MPRRGQGVRSLCTFMVERRKRKKNSLVLNENSAFFRSCSLSLLSFVVKCMYSKNDFHLSVDTPATWKMDIRYEIWKLISLLENKESCGYKVLDNKIST